MLDLGYLEIAGKSGDTVVIIPTDRLLQQTHIIPPKPI